MAIRSGILAQKTARTEEAGGYSPWGHKESDTTDNKGNYFNYVFIELTSSQLGLLIIHFEGHNLPSLKPVQDDVTAQGPCSDFHNKLVN